MDLIFEAKEQFGTLWEGFYTGPGNLKGKSRTRTGGSVTRWRDTEPELRQKFVARYVDSLETIDQVKRVRALEVLSYIAQGRSLRGHWVGPPLHKEIDEPLLMIIRVRCLWRGNIRARSAVLGR